MIKEVIGVSGRGAGVCRTWNDGMTLDGLIALTNFRTFSVH